MNKPLGISGRIAHYFQSAQITPLLALVALLLGIFALVVTPREEEPQINVTMANVLIPFPGASAKDVEQMVSIPAEQVLSQIQGIDHVYSISRPGMSVITVQYKVGIPRIEALVRLYDVVNANADWLPSGLGVLPPIIKPKGIDDVPIVGLTLYSKDPQVGSYDLERVAHSIEEDIKRVPGTREVKTIGGPGRVVNIKVDAARLNSSGLTLGELTQTLHSANAGAPLGQLLSNNQSIQLETNNFLTNAQDVSQLIVGVHHGRPIYLSEVASITNDPPVAQRYVWFGSHTKQLPAEYSAVTVSVTKKPGENAIDVADAVMERVNNLKNTVIPANIIVTETRNYGATANDKAKKLIEKLLFATSCVVALVFFALGRREALIVGSAVILTLTVTLFASWAWGFTLNRVSLFALIFSIGILVDDAIVVVENIHRHQLHHPDKTLLELIPGAVDEVGGPTILATLTVIAALLPMAFVSGLMGPYMSPIPINASMGMLLSLAIAFVVTPWLSRLWLKPVHPNSHGGGLGSKLHPLFNKIFTPLLDDQKGIKNRRKLGGIIGLLIVLSMLLPATGLVLLKMLPFDNKSEFQVMVDMPAGTTLEETAAVMHELGAYLATVPEVINYQAYVGTASPINFNGLVRQYYLRTDSNQGDIQVNLVDKHHRDEQSHAIATRIRPYLQKIGRLYNANIKVVEVPPGPPVLSPIVAEVYGPTDEGRLSLAKAVRQVFTATSNVVDVDDSSIANAPKKLIEVDRRKAALYGVSQQDIVATLQTAFSGHAATWLHDQRKYPAAAWIQMPGDEQGDLGALLHFTVRGSEGQLIPLSELVSIKDALREQPIYHKDLLPVNYVVGDMAGRLDSPLYGMFAMRSKIQAITTPNGEKLKDYFIHQPADPYRHFSIKWDGEWQVTYETFRDMGAAYAVGLILIYLLVVAQFGSYLTPLIIMAPIPLTIIGVMPGHALLGAQYTATSMIGMIALAGIIVRNSILLVDFINLQVAEGIPFKEAIIHSAVTRAQPILLTGLAAMLGAFFILDDPIFNGLAISLIFGIFVSTLLTLIVIPTLYYAAYHKKFIDSHLINKEILP
ncbi:MAG: multidrug transporter AcrB [Ferrovum sp. 37-45-19]|nr:MAG: multidrug transporter AcrB [Ferrovum sp. 21-44-67]OYV93509.1 MAG: multidrug transporter AcrB [Ferrovum sp. 37-45-19]OZB33117.1 MAG: multidrug transporter AcrB [Ferrovum sp. 34-44-207]HQT82192.1 efflux RND transporter permease subunit [Ferrovaceae bacterium]HQU07275.1 efflux RND transporter permease subunit [Ferrovaceae bacterium]